MIAAVLALPATGDPSSAGLKPLDLQVGFTQYAFSDVNRNDAEAAFKVFVQTVARKRGYHAKSSTRVFEEHADFEAEIRAGRIGVAVLDAWRFLAMDVLHVVSPCFVTADRGQPGKRYLLLTRRDSGLDRLEDLRGRDLVEVEKANTNLGQHWLETALRIRGLGTHETFFGRIDKANKASAAVLPVFFGKRSACLVDEDGFAVIQELNPQVGVVLRAVMVSDRFVDGMICLRNDGWEAPQYRQDVVEALTALHEDAAGQQVLTLFRIGRLVPYRPELLETVRRLRADFDRCAPAAHAKTSANPAPTFSR